MKIKPHIKCSENIMLCKCPFCIDIRQSHQAAIDYIRVGKTHEYGPTIEKVKGALEYLRESNEKVSRLK